MTTVVKNRAASKAIALTSKSTNEEIEQALGANEHFRAGLAVCAAIEPTSNEDYIRVMFVQRKRGNNSLNALVLGWEANIERAWQNFNVDREPANLKVGKSANEIIQQVAEDNGVELESGVKIVVTHSLTPRTGVKANGKKWVQAAMTNRKGEALMWRDPATNQLRHVYRNTTLDLDTNEDFTYKNLEAVTQDVLEDIDAPALVGED